MIVADNDAFASKPMPVISTKEKLCVSSTVIADSSNIQSAIIERSKLFGHVLTVFLDEAGSSAMKVATATKNARLGLLVDGDLFAAPFIKGVISDIFELALGSLSEKELEEFAKIMLTQRTVQ